LEVAPPLLSECGGWKKPPLIPSMAQLPTMAQNIQYMQEHALIYKFMRYWPSEKALVWWIKTHWKPKGEVELKLGSKRFFMTIFNLAKYQERVFQGGCNVPKGIMIGKKLVVYQL
jgi:hypothetical protein